MKGLKKNKIVTLELLLILYSRSKLKVNGIIDTNDMKTKKMLTKLLERAQNLYFGYSLQQNIYKCTIFLFSSFCTQRLLLRSNYQLVPLHFFCNCAVEKKIYAHKLPKKVSYLYMEHLLFSAIIPHAVYQCSHISSASKTFVSN